MAKKLLITFIEGSEEKRDYSFAIPSQIIIGRGSSCHIHLDDKKISRKHASIEVKKNGEILVQDLGSTNGTYLNGVKIKETRVKAGDLVRTGRTLFKLDISDSAISTFEKQSKRENTVTKATVKTTVDDLSSKLENGGLKKVILFLHETSATGVIHVNSTLAKKGEIYVRDGNIKFAILDGVFNEKALTRLLLLDKGEINFKPMNFEKRELEIEISSLELLKKCEHEISGLKAFKTEFLQSKKIEINRSTKAPLSRLKPKVIDIFQLVMNYGDADKVLDNSALSDQETYNIISFLLKNKLILRR